MTHPRKQIRDAIKERLEGLELDGLELKPFANRTQNFDPSELPAVSVLTPEETSERADKSGALARTLSVLVVIAINAETAEDADDTLDGWAEVVELRLQPVPIGAARQITLKATSLDLPEVEAGELWIGYLAMEYEAFVL